MIFAFFMSAEMPSEDALRLAQLHNEMDKLHHKLSFIDKVRSYIGFFLDPFDISRKIPWHLVDLLKWSINSQYFVKEG